MTESSKTPLRRKLLLAALLLAALAIFDSWAAIELSSAKAQAATAAMDARACPPLAARLAALRQRPAVAGIAPKPDTELTNLLEQAAKAAGMRPESLVRISPEQPGRLDDTAYLQAPTQVLLKGVTIRQLAAFLCKVREEDNGLEVTAVRLTAPRQEAVEQAGMAIRASASSDAELWTAEATLSSLIYSPRGDTPTPRGTAADKVEP